MSDVIIDVGKNKTSRINLGIQGENIVEHVIFNISSWVEDYGEGVAFIYAKRRGDDEPYPVALDMDMTDKTATWDVTLTDTAAKGKGSAQLVYVVDENDNEDFTDDEVKKTKTYATTVQSSLVVASEENPSGYDTWLEVLGGYTVRVEAAKVAAQTAKTAAEAAQSAAETAEANAEASEDDAETAATNAATSETNAANSATSAAASASSASSSASDAAQSAVEAAQSAVEAANSAGEADVSELNASRSALAASASETNAASSASAAATSESNAKDSEDDAEAAASAAATSETNAAASATAAAGSATNASQSATAASGSASTASTAATTATTKAGEASASATNAAASASAAATSETNAAASAALAEEYAESIDPDTLARIDGYYEPMTVGNAEQLVGTTFEEDQTPYNFRTSGGSMDIGDREYLDAVVGGTVAWNQLVGESNLMAYTSSAGVVTTRNSDGTLTINGTATGTFRITQNLATKKSHVYFVTDANKQVRLYNGTPAYGIANKDIGGLVKDTSGNNWNLYCYENGTAFNDTKVKPNVIDLTAMFGSTIADYIYSLEQATAGAGVAWFKKLFPKPYYEYNAWELISVNTSAHNTVGFNAWDEEVESGYIKPSTGEAIADASKIRMKNYMRVLPNTTYYKKAPSGFWNVYFDADKNYIGYGDANVNATFTTPDNAYYMRCGFETAYGTTYNHDICINLHWDGERDGEYEEYVKHSYPLDSDLTLRGIPKLDASNNLYYDGDTYESNGTVTRKYGIVDLGTLNWGVLSDSPYGNFVTTALNQLAKQDQTKPTYICNAYDEVAFNTASSTADKYIWLNNNKTLIVKDTSKASMTAAEFKTAMSGVYLVYELATPTTETADPYQQIQVVDDFGTEEFVDAGNRDVAIPVGHITRYASNLRAKLEMSPNSPDGDGDYIVRQTNGENVYVSFASNATIQDILARIEALEGGGE